MATDAQIKTEVERAQKANEPDIEADYDASNMLGLKPGEPSACTEFRLGITVHSDAPETEIRQLVKKALYGSRWNGAFAQVRSLVPGVSATPTTQTTEH